MTLVDPPAPSPEALCRTASQWVRNPRRGKATWLVTRGHILKPPFRVDCETAGGILELGIAGSNDRVTTRCNRVVVSKFRQELGLFLVGGDGVVRESRAVAPFPLSKQRILSAFPPGSRFSPEELYERVTHAGGPRPQAHARRRWKELKYDYGFEVDFDGHEYWRGPDEVPISDPMVRPDDNRLREVYWETLAGESARVCQDTMPHCNYCDARVAPKDWAGTATGFDDLGLIDHRRPVFQSGGDELGNLQVFCQTCNNKKNSVCRNCPFGFACDSCAWAYPENHRARRLVLYLDPGTAEALRARFGTDLEARVLEVLKQLGRE